MKYCPCHSGKVYQDCCEPFHIGKAFPSTALQLMRSRYAAYALAKVEYIIKTTHPKNKSYQKNFDKWSGEILHFSQSIEFTGLEIIEFTESGNEATVTFIAHLTQEGRDVSFTEKSRFEKVNGLWLYLEAVYIQ